MWQAWMDALKPFAFHIKQPMTDNIEMFAAIVVE